MSLRQSFTLVTFAALVTVATSAGDKKPLIISDPTTGNDRIDITAGIILDPEEMRNALGGGEVTLPPQRGLAIVKVRVKPVGDNPIRIDLDDFQLISHKDGQRSGPYSPTQLAGNGPTLKIKTETSSVGTGPMTRNTGPTWGGVPGTMGRPQQLPAEGGMVGNGSAGPEVTSGVEIKGAPAGASKAKEDPLLVAMKEKCLRSEEIKEPVTGLLVFPLEGKHKPKDLTLVYKGVGGRLVLSFGR